MLYYNANMFVRLDEADASPLYLQIAAAVRRALVEGEVSAGERLPPARALAETLGVNVHTVLRGYAELEREGLVRIRRGRGHGVTVRGEAPGRARIHELARQLADEAGRLGIGRDELLAIVAEHR
jgi:GntR family transcriptional regulator